MVVNPQELRAITDLGIHEHKPDVRVFESSVYLYFTVHGQSTTLLAHVPFTPSCFIVCLHFITITSSHFGVRGGRHTASYSLMTGRDYGRCGFAALVGLGLTFPIFFGIPFPQKFQKQCVPWQDLKN